MASAAKALARQHIERRRSERVPLRMTLMVCGQSTGKGPFKEETVTMSINSHGALLTLSANVALGQRLLLINRQTWNEVEARVSRLAALDGQGTQVGVEFTQLAPDFWPIGALPKRICQTKTQSA
jgi:PilZ domain-containing protein